MAAMFSFGGNAKAYCTHIMNDLFSSNENNGQFYKIELNAIA